MNPKDIRACASQWQRSARSLEPILRAELAACNAPAAILLLEDAYLAAMKTYNRPLSGLVQMQKYFRRLRP